MANTSTNSSGKIEVLIEETKVQWQIICPRSLKSTCFHLSAGKYFSLFRQWIGNVVKIDFLGSHSEWLAAPFHTGL